MSYSDLNACLWLSQVVCTSTRSNELLVFDIGYVSSKPSLVSIVCHYLFMFFLCILFSFYKYLYASMVFTFTVQFHCTTVFSLFFFPPFWVHFPVSYSVKCIYSLLPRIQRNFTDSAHVHDTFMISFYHTLPTLNS